MNKLWHYLLPPLCAAVTLSAEAAPVMVPALKSPARTYAFFYTDTAALLKKKINPDTFKQSVAVQLAPAGVTPCWTPGDLNSTDIRCGDLATGQMQLGVNELFSYTLEALLPKDVISLPKDANLKQVFIANSVAAGGNITPDIVGRVSRIHFTIRIAQFGMLVDPNSATTVQFIVNDQALPPQALTTGVPRFVAVEDPHGFSDVTIIAGGALGQGFVADRLGFVPISRF